MKNLRFSGSHLPVVLAKIRPWHWNDCNISFEKISDVTIRFMVKRKKNIPLSNKVKLPWDEKQKSKSLDTNNYILHYVIHFDVLHFYIT
jgi:hypothetical protein